MQTLEITDEQYAFIQRLREEISADVVGKYGFVREQDAVQFLIDNLDDDVEVDVAVEFSATDDVADSVSAAIDGRADPHKLEAITYDETADTGSEETTSDSAETSLDEPDEDEDETADDTDSGAADDDDMLDEMMSLLETYDDKWTESSSADYRYTVTLPDGSSEDVQTKDDVRALLFKNYR